MGKNKQMMYERDLVFIGNGDYIKRIKMGMPSCISKKEETFLPTVNRFDARETINRMMINYRKKWTDEETELLRRFLRTNRNSQNKTSIKTMSKILGRTYHSVEDKIKRERKKEIERQRAKK